MKCSTLLTPLGLLIFLMFLIFSCSENNPEVSTPVKKDYRGKNILSDKNFYKVEPKANAVVDYILDSCQHMEAFLLHEEDFVRVTPKLYQLVKFRKFKNTCTIVKDELGLVKEKKLYDAFLSKDRLTKTLRYKIQVEKKEDPIELRLVFTDINKLTEFRFYKWFDEYRPDLIKMKWF